MIDSALNMCLKMHVDRLLIDENSNWTKHNKNHRHFFWGMSSRQPKTTTMRNTTRTTTFHKRFCSWWTELYENNQKKIIYLCCCVLKHSGYRKYLIWLMQTCYSYILFNLSYGNETKREWKIHRHISILKMSKNVKWLKRFFLLHTLT